MLTNVQLNINVSSANVALAGMGPLTAHYFAHHNQTLIIDLQPTNAIFHTYVDTAAISVTAAAEAALRAAAGGPIRNINFAHNGNCTRPEGREYIRQLYNYVDANPIPNPNAAQNRTTHYANGHNDLGYLLTHQSAMCRERAIVLHILLAEIGVPSRVIRADNGAGNRHSWVVYDHPALTPVLGLDPSEHHLWRFPAPLVSLDHGGVYTQNIEWFTVVAPTNPHHLFATQPNWV